MYVYFDLTCFALAQAVVAGLTEWRPRFDLGRWGGGGSNPCKFYGGQSVYETGFSVE